jgi:two-component system OmpR family response regulator
MLPSTLALVDDDPEFRDFLASFLRDRGVNVSAFADGAGLLTSPEVFDFQFYVLDLTLPGVDGLELLRILRHRTLAGVLVVSGRLAPDVFESVITAGADMHLAKPVRFEQVALAITAVWRREAAARATSDFWKLDRRAKLLVAPDGSRVELSETDLTMLDCFLEAHGGTVGRDKLKQALGSDLAEDSDNLLHATIYRLKRRIEKATPILVPLQSQARVGYVFRGRLVAA